MVSSKANLNGHVPRISTRTVAKVYIGDLLGKYSDSNFITLCCYAKYCFSSLCLSACAMVTKVFVDTNVLFNLNLNLCGYDD